VLLLILHKQEVIMLRRVIEALYCAVWSWIRYLLMCCGYPFHDTVSPAAQRPRVVVVAENDCRAQSTAAAAELFADHFRFQQIDVRVNVGHPDNLPNDKADPCCIVVHVLEGQERHGRHTRIVPSSARELYVELASYAYDSRPTQHIIKFESNRAQADHKLTQAFLSELRRRVESVASEIRAHIIWGA
jgi:hypothetical protein